MAAEVVVLVPVLGRPGRAAPLVESITAATPEAHRVLFIASPGDREEHDAVNATGAAMLVVDWSPGPGDYARKINAGYRASDEPLLFLAADDLHFHPGWFAAACAYLNHRVDVVGTNDGYNPRVMRGRHSTHTLVRRSYCDTFGTIDEPGLVLHPGYGHEYCNPPEAPIWMGDLTFRSLGEVRVGDDVVGWAPAPNLRASRSDGQGISRYPREALTVSKVLAVHGRQADLVRVEMESGRVIRCTPDHRWLNGRRPGRNDPMYWTTAREGRYLAHIIDRTDPVPIGLERTAGWLGGIYDGEGSWIQIAQCPIANPDVHAAICAALAKLDIPFTIGRGVQSHLICLTGGRQGYLDFVAKCEPVRVNSIRSKIIGSKRFARRDRITRVSPDGHGDVVSMTTSTGNYVAWGYASRNCDDEFIQTAMRRRRYAHAHDAVVEHLHPHAGKAEMDATYERGFAQREQSRLLYESRRHLWHR